MSFWPNIFSRNSGRLNDPKTPLASWMQTGDADALTNELSLSIIYSAIRIRAEEIASLPCHVVEKQKGHYKPIDHELNDLLTQKANSWQSSYDWQESTQASIDSRGNSYSFIERDQAGKPTALVYLDDREIVPFFVNETAKIFYQEKKHYGTGSKKGLFHPEDILHSSFTSFYGREAKSKSPVQYLKDTIQTQANANDYMKATFRNGAFISGFITMQKSLSPDAEKRFKKALETGAEGVRNKNKFFLLRDGMDFKPAKLTPADIEVISQQRFTAEQLARPYRVPAHMLYDLSRSTNNNIETQSREFVTFCLRPTVRRREAQMNIKLLTPAEYKKGLRVKYNIKGLLEGDIKAQTEHLTKLVLTGIISRNEARDRLGMPAIDGLDEILTPTNVFSQTKPDDNER